MHLITLYRRVYACASSNTNQLAILTVSETCGITSCTSYNQPTFTNVFQQFIKWIQHWAQEMQKHLIIQVAILLLFYLLHIANICCTRNLNGFDLFFLVAEVKCHKLDEIFSRADLYYAADTLHDARRVSGIHLCNM